VEPGTRLRCWTHFFFARAPPGRPSRKACSARGSWARRGRQTRNRPPGIPHRVLGGLNLARARPFRPSGQHDREKATACASDFRLLGSHRFAGFDHSPSRPILAHSSHPSETRLIPSDSSSSKILHRPNCKGRIWKICSFWITDSRDGLRVGSHTSSFLDSESSIGPSRPRRNIQGTRSGPRRYRQPGSSLRSDPSPPGRPRLVMPQWLLHSSQARWRTRPVGTGDMSGHWQWRDRFVRGPQSATSSGLTAGRSGYRKGCVPLLAR